MNIVNRKSKIVNITAFTLVELLVVISIMGILAAMTITVMRSIKEQQYKKAAGAELTLIQTALDNYKAKYGVYPPSNQNPAVPGYHPEILNQLYYELSGTEKKASDFVTLDGSATIPIASVSSAFGVGGFINCSKGSGEDDSKAKNFLSGIKASQINEYVTNNLVRTTVLVTSVGGPDDAYRPLGAAGLNPFRYVYPGTNNPGSYDLWVQLVIRGKTNLICNWSKQVIVNSPLP